MLAPVDCLLFLAYCVLSANAFATAYIYGPMNEALVVRSKRDATPGRSMSFSGYFPNRGMTSYASTADFQEWNRGYRRRPATYFPDEEAVAWKSPQDNDGQHAELTPPKPPSQSQGWDKPEQEEQPPKDTVDKPGLDSAPAKKPKRRRPYHHRQEVDAEEGLEDEEEEGPAGSAQAGAGGNAKASFNAWFPIVFGMFPPSRDRDDYDGYSSRRGQQQQQLHRTTIMANSVSHGAGGVATSHAIYGMPSQLHRR